MDLASTGIWWVPEAPERQVAGTLLESSDDLARLELIGALRELQFSTDAFNPEVILGIAGGKRITLYRCFRASMHLDLLHTEAYLCSFVLVGAHFPTSEAIRFSKMAVGYDALFEWAGLSGLSLSWNRSAEGFIEDINSTFRFPEAPTFVLDRARLALLPDVATEGGPREASITIKQGIVFEVTVDTPLSLEEYLRRYIHDIGNFLALAVGGAVRVSGVTGELIAESGEISSTPTAVVIRFRDRGRHVRDEPRRWHMLFTLTDIGEEAEQAIRRWFARADHLRPIYDLYFGTLFQRGAYIHQRFLSLAQALESYHRRTIGGHHIGEDDFEVLLSALTQVVDGSGDRITHDARASFNNKLRYFNEVSLRRRLKDLVRNVAGLATFLIRDSSRFVERVVDTRNYYTHYDTDAEAGAVAEEDLYLLCSQMQFLLELCFLRELGLSDPTIDALIRRHQRYIGISTQLAVFDPAT